MFKLKSSPLLLALTFCAVAFLPSCGDDDGNEKAPQVTAGFTFKKDAETPSKVAFTNTSTNAKTYTWDFGDGKTSDEENPTHTYAKDGIYTVTLTATNGDQSAEAKETFTTAGVPLIALKGDTSVSIKIGAEYKDAGATALDALDQDISDKIVAGGDSVNTILPGKYVITYDAEDGAGNKAAQVTRTVTVTFDSGLLTNGDFQDGANGWTLEDRGNYLAIKTEEGNSYLHANLADLNASLDSSVTYAAQKFEGVVKGNTYTLSFNASADAAKTIGVGFQDNLFGVETTAAHRKMFKTFDLSQETQRFTYEMTVLSTYFLDPKSTFGSIFFILGGTGGNPKIGYVTFELVEKAKFVTELPADFEDGLTFGTVSSSFMVLSNVANPDPSGNPSANVLKVTRGPGPTATKGTSYFANTFAADFKPAAGAIFKVKIWSPVNDARVEFRLIGSNPNNIASLAQKVTKAKAWEELTFDFSTTANLADGYNGIRINPNLTGDAGTAETFYFDDLRQVDK